MIVVLCYLSGRTVHLLAGQNAVQRLRGGFDRVLDWYGDHHDPDGYEPVTGEPRARDFFDSNRYDGPQQRVIDAVPKLLAEEMENRSPGTDPDSEQKDSPAEVADSFDDSRRVAYSLLFDDSTLYQRYNIQETYYRNLWAVATFALLAIASAALATALVRLDRVDSEAAILIGLVIPLAAVVLWAARGPIVGRCADGEDDEADEADDGEDDEDDEADDRGDDEDDEADDRGDDEDDGSGAAKLGKRFLRYGCVVTYFVGFLTGPAVIFFGVVGAPVSLTDAPGMIVLAVCGLLFLATMFEIRRRQFKRRQERALLNDLFLLLSDTETRHHRIESPRSETDRLPVALDGLSLGDRPVNIDGESTNDDQSGGA
ncbi:hypothetical protein [Halomicrobium salinisoli]|uniref:hypothetical protein n=1 Tax=Halomicrobium salinisoli TaxID=2878391 RepID=UPI001CEFEB98|nr:hypothetical protein [Halomicrobium salinisoli]